MRRELRRVALRPGMGLHEHLVDAAPRRGRRVENGGALGSLDVQLHDEPALAGAQRRALLQDVCERDDLDGLDADLVLGESGRRLQRVAPRAAHHLELGAARGSVHRGTDELPAAVAGGCPLEDGEVRGLGLVRDDRPRAVRRRVRGEVALVAADVEHDGVDVVGRVVRLRHREHEGGSVDPEVGMPTGRCAQGRSERRADLASPNASGAGRRREGRHGCAGAAAGRGVTASGRRD